MSSTTSNPIIKTNNGPVRGRSSTTEDGFNYFSFQGIPYIKQPVGDLRYRDPQPVEPWDEVLDATKEGPVSYYSDCINPYGPKFGGADESININIHTPSFNPNKPLPVYVWIHGGGFIAGSSSTELYGPDYLVEHNLVFVSFNYRIGVTGFLSFRDPAIGIPGNAGLKDQNMALKWVKENIAHFGGDPNNITLAGESAGAASVHYHLISPMSEGLFNRAIIQSGTAFGPCLSVPAESDYSLELAKALGWNGEGGDAAAFKVIAETDIEKVYETGDRKLITKLEEQVFGFVFLAPFTPKVEPYVSENCFLPKPAVELSRDPWSKNIDIIIGGNSDEGLLFSVFAVPPVLEMVKQNPSLLVPYNLRGKMNVHEARAAGDILRNLYFWKSDPTAENFIKYEGDHQFWHGIWRYICQRSNCGGQGKTYIYYLEGKTDPELHVYKALRDYTSVTHLHGCNHTDDFALVFKTKYSGKPKLSNESYKLFTNFQAMYASFIKTGDPNNGLPKGVKWYPYGEIPVVESDYEDDDEEDEGNTPKCLKFTNETVELVSLPMFDRLLVWDRLYDREDLI